LLEDQRSPIVSFQVWYRVGSRNEHRGSTGIAHFLEHLMFKGTPSHGPKQFARLVEENGGQDNAFTSQDVTSYYVDIAADKLDLVIDLEADRMQNSSSIRSRSPQARVVIGRRTRTEDDRAASSAGGRLHRLQGAAARRSSAGWMTSSG
jgi:zinc protease